MKNEVLFLAFSADTIWELLFDILFLLYFCFVGFTFEMGFLSVAMATLALVPQTRLASNLEIYLSLLPIAGIKVCATMLGFVFDVYTASFLFFSLLPNT